MFLPDTLTSSARTVRLTRREFEALPEYSTTFPTGTTLGKRWRRNVNALRRPCCSHLHIFDGTREPDFRGPEWWMGEYAPDPKAKLKDGQPETILIVWSKVILV